MSTPTSMSSGGSAAFNNDAAAKKPDGPEPTMATWYGRILEPSVGVGRSHSMLNAAPGAGPEHPTPGVTPVTWAVVEPDRQADIAALASTLTTVERVLDVDGLRGRIEKLEHEASDPNLWDDQTRAQRVTSELSHTQGELRRMEELRQRLDDLPVLYELAAEGGDGAADALVEADAELKALRADIEAAE